MNIVTQSCILIFAERARLMCGESTLLNSEALLKAALGIRDNWTNTFGDEGQGICFRDNEIKSWF